MIKAVQGGLPYGFCLSFHEFCFLIKHTNTLLLSNNNIAGLDAPMASRSRAWPLGVSVGCLSLGLHPSSPSWLAADKHDEWKQSSVSLSGSYSLWAARLIQGQTWLPSSSLLATSHLESVQMNKLPFLPTYWFLLHLKTKLFPICLLLGSP